MNNILFLNKILYTEQQVRLAIYAYSDLARIRLDSNGKYWRCEFFQCQYEEKRTILEFENYLIELCNSVGI